MTINEMKQSYKQSYTDNVELSIFNCGHEPCLSGHTWGPGVLQYCKQITLPSVMSSFLKPIKLLLILSALLKISLVQVLRP